MKEVNYGWPSYVCPSILVRDELLKHKHRFENEWRNNPVTGRWEELTWTTVLARLAGNHNTNTTEGNTRNVYRVINLEASIINITTAESFLLAARVYIDDTKIPTLPGSRKLAKEMLLIRVEKDNPDAVESDILEYVEPTIALCELIVNDPYNHEKYQNEAPFDVLRKVKIKDEYLVG